MPTLAALVASIVLNRAWEWLYGPTLPFNLSPVGSSLRSGVGHLPYILREQIGVFNYLEVSLPIAAYAIWTLIALALGVSASLVGTRREKSILLFALGAALAVPAFLYAGFMRHTGFGLQGRYVLAFSIVVPLIAGEILARRSERHRAPSPRLLAAIAVCAGVVQFVAWWTNARRFAIGTGGPWWFLTVAEWVPPGGWWPWVIVAAAGASLLPVAAIADGRLSRR
jgi:uncharacterized membrane protein